MPPPEPPTTISLKVKVPPGTLTSTSNEYNTSSDHFDLGSFQTTSTISQLRQQIQLQIPTNPTPERQRILYGGRALTDNDQTLAEALNTKRDPEQREYVVHLLVRADGDATGDRRTPTPNTQQREQQQGRSVGAAVAAVAAGMNGQQAQGQMPAQGQGQGMGQMPNVQRHQQLLGQHQAMIRNLQMQQQQMFQQLVQHAPHMQQQRGGMPVSPPNGQFHAQQQTPNLPGWPAINPTVQNQQGTANGDVAANVENSSSQDVQPQPQLQDQSQGQAQAPYNGPSAASQTQHAQPPQARQPPYGQGVVVEGIGPNGQRFQYHQHTMQVPAFSFNNAMPGMAMPAAGPTPPHPQHGQYMPPIPIPFPPPPQAIPTNTHFQQADAAHRTQANAPSALDRARQNIAEMRRMLDELATENIAGGDAGTEERGRRINDMQTRARSVNEYIDPLNLGTSNAAHVNGEARQPPTQQPNGIPQNRSVQVPMTALRQRFPRAPPNLGQMPFQQPPVVPPQELQRPSNPSEVTAYLLSSPQGPHAIVFSPQHGTYTHAPRSSMTTAPPAQNQNYSLRPTPTQPGPTGHQQNPQQQHPQQPDAVARAAQGAAQPAANPAANQDPLNLQNLLNHFWMLVRILIFSYFLLGGNLGWQRPLMLLAIGIGFAVLRMGMLGGNARVDNFVAGARGWWDGVVGVPQGRVAERAGQWEGVGAPGQQARETPANAEANANATGRPAPMPTPAQAAQRILAAEAAQQQQRRTWLREQLRPVERALALFVASLWPGIGEAHVREQRRLREEEQAEVARQREEEEEASRARENEQREGEDGSKEGSAETAVGGEAHDTSTAAEGIVGESEKEKATSS